MFSTPLVVEWDLQLFQMDITSAHLNGTLEDEVNMELPDRYKRKGKVSLEVCLLLQSIAGLKQSGSARYKELKAIHGDCKT